jgi:hypothetical protein
MFSVIGAIANKLIGWALPGFSAVWLYLIGAVIAIGLPAAWAYGQGTAGKAVAIAQCQSSCTLRLSRMETAAERTIADILSSVDGITDASKDVAQYCERHPGLCRSEK